MDFGFLSEIANKFVEPYRGLPFGSYLHATPPRRQRTLTGPLDPTHDSFWHRLQVFSAVEPEQLTYLQEQCAFLARLPFDIRMIIYEMVLGGMVFHIQAKTTNDPRSRLLRFTCKQPDRIYEESYDVHVPCFEQSTHRPSSAPREDYLVATGLLPLLVTCRRIYSEAIDILYSSNTFEFTQNRIAFRFLKAMIPPQRLQSIRRFRWDIRLPYHPNISTRARRDWSDLFAFFTNDTTGLQHLYLKLQPLHPMQAEILRTKDEEASGWIQPIILMAIDASRKRHCKVDIMTNGVLLEPDDIFKSIAHVHTAATLEKILELACAEMHRRIRLSLDSTAK